MADPNSDNERDPLLRSTDSASSYRSNSSAAQGYPRLSPGLGVGCGTVPTPFLASGEENEVPGATSKRSRVVLLCVVVTYFMGYIPSMVIMNPYLYDRISEEYGEINISSEVPCVKDPGNITNKTAHQIEVEIQKRVVNLELYLHLTTYLSAVLPILLLGPITDRFGRRIGFLMPITGTLLKQVVYIVVVRLKLSLSFLYLAHAIEAMGGSFAAMLGTIFSVTSDMTRAGAKRSGWIAAVEALQTLSAALGQVAVAQWMERGYYAPLVGALGICILCWLLVLFFMPETNPPSLHRRNSEDSNHVDTGQSNCCNCWHGVVLQLLKNVWRMICVNFSLYSSNSKVPASTNNSSNIVWKRRLCLIIFILTVAVNFSTTSITNLYLMRYPLCWASTKVYTVGGLRIFISWVIILAALAVLQGCFKTADRHVAIIGVLSGILCNAVFSFAHEDYLIYIAIVFGIMVRAIIPMLRSVLSSLVDQTYQGAMYSGLSSIETLGPSAFSTAANRIYHESLSTWAGEVFLVFACIMFVAFIPLLILNMIFARETPDNASQVYRQNNIQED